jgi:hypothetical protein
MPNLQFLLTQGDKVLDHADRPEQLNLDDLDQFAGFKVALGYRGKARKIIGIAADVAPLSGCATWRISSAQDGLHRLINSGGCPARLVKRRLRVMFQHGWYDDLTQLPLPVVLTPGEMGAELVD